MTCTVFDPVAATYDRLRPGYPAELYDALEREARVGLDAATVIEVGAGTGIATRGLRGRGAHILAVDLSAAMLAVQPRGCAVVARGERLPVADGRADLVVAATSWHWIDMDGGSAEAARVLRPGGALAVWWNRSVDDLPWVRARQKSLDRRGVLAHTGYARDEQADAVDDALHSTGHFTDVTSVKGRWLASTTVDDAVDALGTHSAVIRLGADRAEFLAEQRAVLEAAFPSGIVREPIDWDLHVARTAG